MRSIILKIAISIIVKHIKYLEKKYYYDSFVSHPVNAYSTRTIVPEESKIKHELKHGLYYFKTAQAAIFTRNLLLQLGAVESFETVYEKYEKYEGD